LLLLNYSAGTLLQVTPDFTLVPFAPTVTAAPDGDSVSLEWRPRTDGVSAAGYAVERVRDNAVTERLLIERTAVQLTWSEGDCFRVRPQAANGQFGPPSPPACYSTP
jgi:hypothetical protein